MGHLATGNAAYCTLDGLLQNQSSHIMQVEKPLHLQTPIAVISQKGEVVTQRQAADEICKNEDVAMKMLDVTVVDADVSEASEEEMVGVGEDFVHGLGIVFTRWAQAESAPHQKGRFHSVRAPPLSIYDYLVRIRTYFLCSDECFVLGLVYIDRASRAGPAMAVCDLTVHRLLCIAVIIAAKFHDDIFYSNAYYAKVGGLKLQEVNMLEAKMLDVLEWKTHVSTADYQLYRSLVCQSANAVAFP